MISELKGQKIKLLFSSQEISNRVRALGRKITEDYKSKDLVIVGVLKGALIFLSDLIRHIELNTEIDFIRVSSYKNSMEAGKIELLTDISVSLKDKDVLLIEDLLDTGGTLDFIKKEILSREPASLKMCTLIKKKKTREDEIEVDYIGFEIEDRFIVGYGMDLAEEGRNIPDIYTIEKDDV